MAWETWVQSQVESYQWYLMLPCLTLSIIRYGSRVVVVAIEKGAFGSPSTMVANFTYFILYIYIYIYI